MDIRILSADDWATWRDVRSLQSPDGVGVRAMSEHTTYAGFAHRLGHEQPTNPLACRFIDP